MNNPNDTVVANADCHTADQFHLPTQFSLSTATARHLSTTTKSIPHTQEISSRWLIKMLPWVQTTGGTYRVNRSVNTGRDALINMISGHVGEQILPATFVDYEAKPREYELAAAQTILQIHTRVADLYNGPMDQTEQQLRLTIEALRERQEYDLINNPDFGLLHNVAFEQRISTRNGPPSPDDLDDLLCRRRQTDFLLMHPKTLAAFGHECNRRGLSIDAIEHHDSRMASWRGVPMLPCTKVPISADKKTTILAMRTGEDNGGVIGLHQMGIPDEYEPSLSVRFMGINEKAIISYLVTNYYSVAVLLPDALGVLENVEVG